MIDLRFPSITATTAEGKLSQMQSYIHQLVEQLNFALSAVDSAASGNVSNVVMPTRSAAGSEKSATDTFNSIKALIIKSADIVTAYEETIRKRFEGKYFAKSDFGTFVETTKLNIEQNSKGVTELFENIQNIGVKTEGTDVRSTKVYIKRGYLGNDENGNAIYGIALGEIGDDGKYKNYAWFTPGRLSFFDDEGNEVAYISKRKLYITEAYFTGAVIFKDYKMDSSDGLAFVWVGGN